MAYKVGIDIGGTFTDLYAYDTQTGKSLCLSSSSTPENYANGVLNVIEKSKIRPEDIELIVHGTTVATNAVIMKTYEKTAFVTTKGMRDLIEIGRFHRKVLYDPYQQKPEPIVSRDNRFTVEERIDKDGNVLEALNENDVRQVAAKIREKGITSVCVGFMNSYVNGKHEKRAAEILKEELSDAYVIASSQILPNIGALGRFTTGIINAALYHLVSNYIENLEDRLRGKGFKGKLLLVQSNGGAITAELVRTKPETLLMSGPAGGVVGALSIGKVSGQEDIITFDMGGTSTDISIIEKSKPFMSSDFEIDWDMPVPIPLIEIISIGAGGGSIAWVDSGGVLKVGPRSAGAYPGPVCYGAVSYTHLDVYKRQDIGRFGIFFLMFGAIAFLGSFFLAWYEGDWGPAYYLDMYGSGIMSDFWQMIQIARWGGVVMLILGVSLFAAGKKWDPAHKED